MSAWLCSDKHVSTLAQSAFLLCPSGYDSAEVIAQLLHDENIKSLVARYGWGGAKEWHKVIYSPLGIQSVKPEQLLCLLSSYDYQACEDDTWETSDAFNLSKNLRNKLVHQITEKPAEEGWWRV